MGIIQNKRGLIVILNYILLWLFWLLALLFWWLFYIIMIIMDIIVNATVDAIIIIHRDYSKQ
jgi:hypothetical protein